MIVGCPFLLGDVLRWAFFIGSFLVVFLLHAIEVIASPGNTARWRFLLVLLSK